MALAFLEKLGHKARRRMCPLYVAGLIGPGDRKSVQPIAERMAPGDYDQLHHFIADGVWNAAPLEAELLVQADRLAGAKMMYPGLPEAKTLIADKGYDSDEFRNALEAKGIEACIPPKINRRKAIPFDKVLYKQRHKIENMFGKLNDWRRNCMLNHTRLQFGPADGDLLQADQPVGSQRRHAVGPPAVQQLAVLDAEVGKRVIERNDSRRNRILR